MFRRISSIFLAYIEIGGVKAVLNHIFLRKPWLIITEIFCLLCLNWVFFLSLFSLSPTVPPPCYFSCTSPLSIPSFSTLTFLGLTTQSLFFIEPGKELEQWIILNMINPTLNPAMRLQQGSTCNSKPYYRATNASWGWRITAQPAAM